MQEKGWKQIDLADAANLPTVTISRIMRNSNDRGGPFYLTEEIIAAIAVAFEKGEDGWRTLSDAAFPERRLWIEALRSKDNIIKLNMRLCDNGLPQLGLPYTED